MSELVGRWYSALLSGGNYATAYSGPSGDLTGLYASVGDYSPTTIQTMQDVDRFREAFIRPLAAVGNTRVWNLMIDLVVQSGSYGAAATSLDNFTVNGEQRYWLHEAIDRSTGQIVHLSSTGNHIRAAQSVRPDYSHCCRNSRFSIATY